jgi:membrane fusion protein, heavy metal efflux system
MTAHDCLRFTRFVAGWTSRAPQFFVTTLLVLATAAAFAGPGHDHGDEAPTAAGPASPRFAEQSDLFELVGIAQGEKLTLYLDRFENNAPVTNAKIEVEMQLAAGAAPYKAQANLTAEGAYEITHPQLAQPGNHALQFTIAAGNDIDLLAGNLDIPHPHAGHYHHHGWLDTLRSPAVWGSIVVLMLGILGWLAARAWRKRRGQGALT